jgi:hypothetical protein
MPPAGHGHSLEPLGILSLSFVYCGNERFQLGMASAADLLQGVILVREGKTEAASLDFLLSVGKQRLCYGRP